VIRTHDGAALYAVILAGGGGTRLWPLSDPERPKPFLPLLPDGSLLQRTVKRITEGHELGLDSGDLTIVTDARYEALVRSQVDVAVLSEPFGRNTAAAIALAVLAIDRPDDDVMVILPADHLIAREDVFRGVLAAARDELAQGAFGIESPIVTLGAQANGPATQYGYLVPDPAREQRHNLHGYVLKAFVEKPDSAHATELLKIPDVAWNAGIFMARRRAFRLALENYTNLVDILGGRIGSTQALAAAYESIESRSIDYAVMEPAAADGQVVMAGMDVGWSDVGTWGALIDALAGEYRGAARVVQPGEEVQCERDDLVVSRDDAGRLALVRDRSDAIVAARPIAFLPSARPHAAVIQALLDRANHWEADFARSTNTPVEVLS
jgi:mannose-1-phosphate guanylyltransferase